MRERQARDPIDVPARQTNWTTVSLIGALVLMIGVVVYMVMSGNPDQDKLTNTKTSTSAQPANRDKLCASSATYDLIKRELFRRAAELRGSDQAAFDKVFAYAIVRMGNPVMESQDASTGAVNCSGSLSVDLPPSVALISYTLTGLTPQPAFYAKVTGTGITPIGAACQLQAASVGGTLPPPPPEQWRP